MYILYMMQVISTTAARKRIGKLVEHVRETGEVVAIGRRNKPEVIIAPYPHSYNPGASDIVNLAAASDTFDFLWDEPDLYSDKDVKWRYAKSKRRKSA